MMPANIDRSAVNTRKAPRYDFFVKTGRSEPLSAATLDALEAIDWEVDG